MCQNSAGVIAIVTSSLYSVNSSEQLSLVPLPLENQVCAGVVGRMLRYSQWVKKGASFHPARAPLWLNAEREELLGSCYSCYAMYMGREAHHCQLLWFHSNHCNHGGLNGILCISINFLFSLIYTMSSFLMPCSGAEATDYFLQNASLGNRLMKVRRG